VIPGNKNVHFVTAAPKSRFRIGTQFDEKSREKRSRCNETNGRRYKQGDYSSAFEYSTKAAALGDVRLIFNDHDCTIRGKVMRDRKYYKEVASGCHWWTSLSLGVTEMANGRPERAVKHWIIAANLGFNRSIKELWECYVLGFIVKMI
jgi:hypothetical protein